MPKACYATGTPWLFVLGVTWEYNFFLWDQPFFCIPLPLVMSCDRSPVTQGHSVAEYPLLHGPRGGPLRKNISHPVSKFFFFRPPCSAPDLKCRCTSRT